MNFRAKNFSYSTKTFGDFIDQAERGAKVYLRSLSADRPSEIATRINDDFPSIASDFQLPSELDIVTGNESFHSSVLRISGPVNMWLHYDVSKSLYIESSSTRTHPNSSQVMANILCQIKGGKRVLLFPPSDVKEFGFEPGASSSDLNIFAKRQDGSLAGTHPQEAILSPGDVLFLPQLWLHTAAPTSDISVAINVFFRGLPSSRYAAGRDVYGNRDIQAYEKGRQDIAKIIRSFEGLPTDVKDFYLTRLAQEFELRK